MSKFGRPLVGVLIAQIVACAAVVGIDDPADKRGGDAGTAPAAANARFVQTDDTVFDQGKKLTWQRKTPELRLTWADARTYCATLSLGADKGPWRLPTKEELLTSFELGAVFSGENRADAPKGWFWSISESTHRAGGAWAVGVGSYANVNDVTSPGRVRCVR